MSRNAILNPDGTLQSDLWIDHEFAATHIEREVKRGAMTAAEGERLSAFCRDGYCVLDIELPDRLIRNIEDSLELLWAAKPVDVLVAGPGYERGPFADIPADGQLRKPGFRIMDLHAYCEGARQLYLHDAIHRFCQLIYRDIPVATQSLYFEYGSTQNIHRDPWYVVTAPASSLLAVWIALEDIHPDSGALVYVPGSHRLPFLPTATGDVILHDPRLGEHDRGAAYQHMHQQIEQHGLIPQTFCARRGQVLFWHAGLAHGGGPVTRPELTRKSFVVHFDRLRHHISQSQRFRQRDGSTAIARTERLMFCNGRVGFDSPTRNYDFNRELR